MSRQPPTRTCTAVRTLTPADPRGQWASSVEELVPDPGAALDHAGPLVDQPAPGEEARCAHGRVAAARAQRSAGAQLLGRRLAQAALSAVVEALVEGLVAQMPRRSVGVGLAQVRGDLRRAPLQLEPLLHDPAQPRLAGEQRTSRPLRP